MALYSGQMHLLVPGKHASMGDRIHFEVRPRLSQLGIQCLGLTKNHVPHLYGFDIQMEGDLDTFATTLEVARTMALHEFGLELTVNRVP